MPKQSPKLVFVLPVPRAARQCCMMYACPTHVAHCSLVDRQGNYTRLVIHPFNSVHTFLLSFIVCLYICLVCVCVCVSLYVFVCVSLFVCVCVRFCVSVCVCVRMHSSVFLLLNL